jgi:hypothetical protein
MNEVSPQALPPTRDEAPTPEEVRGLVEKARPVHRRHGAGTDCRYEPPDFDTLSRLAADWLRLRARVAELESKGGR